jgi:hypothetical protein
MRKCGEQDISSLDMLLDTMCNTFGGIVFIALLISIISSSLRYRDAQNARESNETVVEVDRDIEANRLVREQEELHAAMRHLEATLVKTGQERGSSGAELGALVASNEILRCTIDALGQTNAVLATAIIEMEQVTKRDMTTESDLRSQIAKLSDDLKEKRQEARRTVRLPRLHAVAGKSPVFVAIKDGKYYAVSRLPRQGRLGQMSAYDTEDVTVELCPGMDVIEARKNSGQVVIANCERQGKLALTLSGIDRANEFVSFAVYTNSFAEFNYVKALFVEKGFEYNWIVLDGALQIVVATEPHEAQ